MFVICIPTIIGGGTGGTAWAYFFA